MITKIEFDKDGKKTIYEIKDEAVAEKEISKVFNTIHEELKTSMAEIEKAMKWVDEFKLPKFSFPDFEFPRFSFPKIEISFPKLEEKNDAKEKD